MSSDSGGARQLFVPMLAYRDAGRAIEFLCRAFGFEERFRMEGEGGTIGHAELGYQGHVIALASAWDGAGMASPSELGGVHTQLLCYVTDVDAHHARARAAGAIVINEPADEPYGIRRYRVTDLEGHRWMFASPLEGGAGQ